MPDDELYGGTLEAFADSMAEEMEKALNQVRVEAGLDPFPIGDPDRDRDRRLLFIAIARGIINHLEKKEKAFMVTVNSGAHTHTGHPDIQVKRPPELP